MKYAGHFFLISIALVLIWSCQPEEEKITGSSGVVLKFSTDTVLFDTLLTARTSITKRFRIKNTSDKAVSISSIRLGMGTGSQYSIVVNGKVGSEIKDEVLFGKDSLLVLVDVEIDPQDQNLPYLVKDSVIVDWNGNTANVKLVAWGQDANFINAETICDEIWTADRPYVIYNYAFVDSACQLTIEPGARIYLDNGADLFVQGTLKVLGDSGNHVVFRNTRFDENYIKEAPGQWRSIWFLESSRDNEIHYADIENAQTGIVMGYTFVVINDGLALIPDNTLLRPQLEVHNSSIRYMSAGGVVALDSELKMVNCEVFYSGSFLVANLGGGEYQYDHCTFSNYPNDFQTEDPAFVYSDEYEVFDGYVLRANTSIQMRNSIVWGANDEEFYGDTIRASRLSVVLDHNIIRSKLNFGENNFTSVADNYPGFVCACPGIYNYQLDSTAFARDKGIDLGYADDILGKPRDEAPDIGAYERIDQ